MFKKINYFTVIFTTIFLAVLSAKNIYAEGFNPYVHEKPYVAEPYVPPPPPVSKLRLIDNGDGTLTDPDSGLMWAQKDSYADLGNCLNWYKSVDYVDKLETGGYSDWRLPRQMELYGICDHTKFNNMAWDHDAKFPLHLDEKFADGAAYWVWTQKHYDNELTDCCAVSFYFVVGQVHLRGFSACDNGGVRAVRDIVKKN